MRLIDADKFKKYIDAGHLRSGTEICFSELDIVNMIDKQPTIEPGDKTVQIIFEDGRRMLIADIENYMEWSDNWELTDIYGNKSYVFGKLKYIGHPEMVPSGIEFVPVPEKKKGLFGIL